MTPTCTLCDLNVDVRAVTAGNAVVLVAECPSCDRRRCPACGRVDTTGRLLECPGCNASLQLGRPAGERMP